MAEILPTMNDDAVMDFVASGYVVLKGIVDEDFNRHCSTASKGAQVSALINSPEFVREVLLQAQIAGVVRSLLGADFLVPTRGHNHLFEAPHVGQTWHSDGLSGSGWDVTELQCYYYPEAVDPEDGPTTILPGSHCRAVDREAIAHYGDIVGQVPLVVPAGTVALTRYGIWHKAGAKLNRKYRSMIKFSYFRQAAPRRDWLIDSEEVPNYVDRARMSYVSEVEAYRDSMRRIRTWNWLCGLDEAAYNCRERVWPAMVHEARPASEIAA